jgi:hypothetical protein
MYITHWLEIFLSLLYGIKGPKTWFFWVFGSKTHQNSTSDKFFFFAIGKAISHITKCISDFWMVSLGHLDTVTGSRLSLASYSKSNFFLPKLYFFKISIWNSESALNSASDDVKFNRILKKTIFDGPEVPYKYPMNRENRKSFFDSKKYLILLRI